MRIAAVGFCSKYASTKSVAIRSSNSQSNPLYAELASSTFRCSAFASLFPCLGISGIIRNTSLNSKILRSIFLIPFIASLPALSLSNRPTNRYLGSPLGSKLERANPRKQISSRFTPRVPPSPPSPAAIKIISSPNKSLPLFLTSNIFAMLMSSASVVPSTRTVRGRNVQPRLFP